MTYRFMHNNIITRITAYWSTRIGRVFLLLTVFTLQVLTAAAITKQNADAEYQKGNYQQAIRDYEELLQKGVSADLYYNLGNAYFRSDNITRAVLSYERALMLSPGDDDIRFNLQFARSRTIDKITPESEMFFVTWYHAVVNLMSVDSWARTGIVSIVLALVLMLVFLFAPTLSLRKVGFFGCIVMVCVFLFSQLFAYQQKSAFENRSGAIVVSPSVNVKKTPVASGSDEFVIHEGTRVDITDRSMKKWYGIRLADGREGWILAKDIEEI